MLNLTIFIVCKFVFTTIAVGCPISCGVFTPVFLVGAATGRCFGEILNDLTPSRDHRRRLRRRRRGGDGARRGRCRRLQNAVLDAATARPRAMAPVVAGAMTMLQAHVQHRRGCGAASTAVSSAGTRPRLRLRPALGESRTVHDETSATATEPRHGRPARTRRRPATRAEQEVASIFGLCYRARGFSVKRCRELRDTTRLPCSCGRSPCAAVAECRGTVHPGAGGGGILSCPNLARCSARQRRVGQPEGVRPRRSHGGAARNSGDRCSHPSRAWRERRAEGYLQRANGKAYLFRRRTAKADAAPPRPAEPTLARSPRGDAGVR